MMNELTGYIRGKWGNMWMSMTLTYCLLMPTGQGCPLVNRERFAQHRYVDGPLAWTGNTKTWKRNYPVIRTCQEDLCGIRMEQTAS